MFKYLKYLVVCILPLRTIVSIESNNIAAIRHVSVNKEGNLILLHANRIFNDLTYNNTMCCHGSHGSHVSHSSHSSHRSNYSG